VQALKSYNDQNMLESFGLTDVGRRRPANEDNFVVETETSFFAVCDGLGGQNAGEVASGLAVETLSQFIDKSHRDRDITWPYGLTMDLSFDGNRMLTAIGLANKKVFREADDRPEYTGMGTTVVAALVRGPALTVGWVGDSRLYIIRGGVMQQVTDDHTWVNMARRAGTLTAEQAVDHPWGHVLVRAVGSRDTVDSEIAEARLESGDMILLCSDGLTVMLKDEAILKLLTPAPATLEEGARKLVAAANEAGGKDNITVVLLRYTAS
jgi:serine/threonine protein phosphatase PrpC